MTMMMRKGEGDAPEPDKIDLAPDEEENKVRVDDADDDDSDGGDEPEPEKGAPSQGRKKDGTWAAKKAERGKERKAAKAWEQERADYDRRFRQIQEDSDRTTRQLREELDRIRASGQQGQAKDPFEAQLDDIGGQIEKELALIEADEKRGYKEYNKLRRKEQEIITLRAISMHAAETRRQQASQPQDPYAPRRPIIESEYPWVADDRYRELAQRARAYREYLIHVQRKPDTIETDREALSHAQATFGPEYGLAPPPAPPSARTRGLYGVPGSRGTPARTAPPREVNLGVMGNGHGLSPAMLAAAVREGLADE